MINSYCGKNIRKTCVSRVTRRSEGLIIFYSDESWTSNKYKYNRISYDTVIIIISLPNHNEYDLVRTTGENSIPIMTYCKRNLPTTSM